MADWLGRLSAFLPGAAGMADEDKRALITQGLLAMGAGILKNNSGNYGKAGPAIGAGISEGLLAMNKGADNLSEQKYRQQVMERGYGDPAGLREFQALTEGLSPEEVEQARRVRLGIEGRASSAGFQPIKFKGPDGRERVGTFNGRTGRIDTPDGLSFEPSTVTPIGPAQPSYQVDPSLPPEVQAAIRQAEASGQPLPPQIDLAPAVPRPSPTAGVNPFVGPAPGDVAYAEEAARQAAQLQAMPAALGMQTNAAIEQAGGTTAASEAAKTTAEAQRNLPKVIQQSEMMLDTINKLESHPGLPTMLGLSGTIDPRNYIPGTEVQGARALADQIQGQTFLQAYQALKGGGQITQIEGNKGEAAIARLSRAQNERDYRAALNDLRDVINSGLQRARSQAGGRQPSGSPQAPADDPMGIL